MKAQQQRTIWQRLDVSVGIGLLAGCLYTAIDVYLDHEMGAVVQPSAHPIQLFHALLDLVLPAVTGALLGMVLYLTRERARSAAFEKQRADDLSGRLHKIERDQAVWVISAALLHEVKNPLHSLGLLLDEVSELPSDAAQERTALLERARVQSERIEGRLMALRSLENTRPPHLPAVELKETLTDIIEPLARLAARRGVQLSLHGGPIRAYAHPSYLSIILENLIENALDALEKTSNPEIQLRIEAGEQHAKLLVSDNGPGLDTVEGQHVFEPLYSHKPTGLGLGLSIARGLARSMGGELTAASQDHGATFSLQLKEASP